MMHCMLEEPKATILSHMHSTNSNSLSSIARELDLDLFKKSLDTFMRIWKMVPIAESNSDAVASVGLFLHIYITNGENKILSTKEMN